MVSMRTWKRLGDTYLTETGKVVSSKVAQDLWQDITIEIKEGKRRWEHCEWIKWKGRERLDNPTTQGLRLYRRAHRGHNS